MASPIELVRGFFRNPFALYKPDPYMRATRAAYPRQLNRTYYESFLELVGMWGSVNYDPKRKQYIEDGYMKNGDVYAIVNQIATKSSNVPFSIRLPKDRTMVQNMKSRQGALLKGGPREHLELKMMGQQAYQEQPLVVPLDRPNPHQTWPEFIALLSVFWNTCGENMIYWTSPKSGINAGKPAQIFCLPAHLMEIVPETDWKDQPVGKKPIKGFNLINRDFKSFFPADRVIHMTMANPHFDLAGSHLYGMSPLRAVWPEIEAGNAGNDTNFRMQQSGGAIGLIHGVGDPLETEQAKQLKDRIVEMRKDPTVMAQIAAITMEIDFKRIALGVKDSGMYESQTYVQKKIANALNWDTKMLNNDDGAKYDNMIEAYKTAVTNKIMPDLNVIAEAFTKELLPKFGGQYKGAHWVFHYEQLPEIQEDIKQMTDWILPLIREGVISRAEARSIMNFPKLSDTMMDIITTNVNTLKLSTAVEEQDLDNIVE